MSRQYKRAYELEIETLSGEVKTITDLRIIFDISKSIISSPNLAKIDIYNANDKTLSMLQERFTKIVLKAGYEGNIKVIFKGEVRNVFQNRTGLDKITTIYSGDGQKDWENSTVNKTYENSVSVKTMIEDVLSSFSDLSIGELEGLPDSNDKLRGLVLSGSSKDVMDSFAEEYGFDWSIQDGQLITTELDTPLRPDEAVLVTSKTGMIGSPTITELGVEVTTLLNPKLSPNNAFKIESLGSNVSLGNLNFVNRNKTKAEGLYKVLEVNFKGDSREGDWLSNVVGRSFNG